ncbi:translocating chain-associated membrane protein 1-like 1 [Porphyrio hochstetteri]
MGLCRKYKSPVVLSHEFIIQNHADTTSCLVMGLLLGLMFEVPAKYAIIFIAVQYNFTYTTVISRNQSAQCLGKKRFCGRIIPDCEKINRRLLLSKTKHSKFNASGQLLFFYLFSFIWGASILNAEELMKNPTLLWKDYPHARVLEVKFFYICQIAYWLHAVPKIHFQKIQKLRCCILVKEAGTVSTSLALTDGPLRAWNKELPTGPLLHPVRDSAESSGGTELPARH